MLEIREKLKKDSNKVLKPKSKDHIISGTVNLVLPRDVVNANALILGQVNLNKYSWETDGAEVKFSHFKHHRS